jgi:hypothetical protein
MRAREEDMKEVFTKSFWRDVRKTFHDALDGQPAEDQALQAPPDADPKNSSTSEIKSPSIGTNEQH